MRPQFWTLCFGASLFGLGLACAGVVPTDRKTISKGINQNVNPKGPADATGDPAPTETSILTAGVQFGSFLCTEKSGNNCKEASTRFSKDTPLIYFIHQTKDIPTAGQTFTTRWIAMDVGEAAPPGTQISTYNNIVEASSLSPLYTHFSVSSQLSIPDAGWPVGDYSVQLTLDSQPVATVPFTIQ
jgi:hypothetical protein